MDSFSEGKWLFREGWCIFPQEPSGVLHEFVLRLKKAAPRLDGCKHSKIRASTARRIIPREWQQLPERETARYNAQPNWSLKDISVASQDAVALVTEFLEFVEVAADEFCWPLSYPSGEMEWHRHSWKHVSFKVVQSLAKDVVTHRYPPPQVLLKLLGTRKQAKQLFRRAQKGEGDAIGRLHYFFPREADRLAAAECRLTNEELTELVPLIRGVVGPMEQYLETTAESPGAPEAKRAEDNLQRFIRAAKGSPVKVGRPGMNCDEIGVKLLNTMSHGLFKQIRQVDDFLKQVPARNREKNWPWSFYPWLKAVPEFTKVYDCGKSLPGRRRPIGRPGFLQMKASDGANAIAGHVLGLSPSKIAKIVYRQRS
jgi:hypothetical protein